MVLDLEGAKRYLSLAAALFLDGFEKLVMSEKASDKEEKGRWEETGYLEGAMALVKFRGQTQCDTQIGMSLYQKLSSIVLTSCLEKEVEVPAQFIAVNKLAARSSDTSNLRWRFREVAMRLICLKVC